MPLGHAIQSFYAGPAKGNAPAGGGRGAPGPGLQPFSRDLLDDVMPLVEQSFKVAAGPDNRAIAGLSMGGGQSMNVAFNRPALFRYVVLMSPAVPPNVDQAYADFFKDPGIAKKNFKLLWIGVGKDDTLVGAGDKALDAALTKADIAHKFELSDGRHEWTVWRHQLNEIAPLLFR
jgi:enterochelin esterase family protein